MGLAAGPLLQLIARKGGIGAMLAKVPWLRP